MTLKNRILSIAIGGSILVALVCLVGFYLVDSYKHDGIEHTRILDARALLDSQLVARLNTMRQEIRALTRNRGIAKALKRRDEAALAEAASPSFNRTSSSGSLDAMIIADSHGMPLFSTLKPLLGGAASELLARVAGTKKIEHDLVEAVAGRPALMLAFPLYSRGKMKGIGAYLTWIENITASLASTGNTEVVLWNGANEIVHASDPELGAAIHEQAVAGTPDWSTIHVGERHFSSTYFPLKSHEDLPVASIAILHDVSDSHGRVVLAGSIQAVVTGLTIITIIALLWLLISRAFTPVGHAARAVANITAGDLRTDIVALKGDNEVLDMLDGIRQMRERLRRVIHSINELTGQLNSATSESADAIRRIDAGARRQQADTQSVAEAMDQMTRTVREVEENAVGAEESAKCAEKQAGKSRDVMAATLDAMQLLSSEVSASAAAIDAVNQESEAIGQILNVIQSIAEQTNLLALNAAIEAARAGEQGRGFAVVADEVRSLANRTQDATTEIRGMIETLRKSTHAAVGIMRTNQQRAEASVGDVATADTAIDAINQGIGRITGKNRQIVAISHEHGEATRAITERVHSISQIAIQTAEQAAHSAAASENLTQLADRLRNAISHFRL